MSPMLFLVAIDWVVRRTVGNKVDSDINARRQILQTTLHYYHLMLTISDLNLNAIKVGLKINKKKTKTMQIVQSPPQITLEK